MTRPHPTVRWGCAAAAVVLVLAAVGCSSSADDNSPNPVVSVQVAPVAQGPLEQWVHAQAVLYPLHQAIITPKISAPVARFYVQRGDHVRAGELLATLENKDLQAAAQDAEGQLQAAQAAYATATAGTIPANLKRAQLDVAAAKKTLGNAQMVYSDRQNLFKQGAIPRLSLEQAGIQLTNAQNAYELAQQNLQALEKGGHSAELAAAKGNLVAAEGRAAAAQAQLAYSKITSPIDGVVTDRPMYPGELATPSAPLMTIMQMASVVARTSLPADQAALLKVGDTATLAPADGGPPVTGKVMVVSPATDPGSTTIEVWVEAPNSNHRLQPGTSVSVAILARTLPQAVTIPASAVLTDSSGGTSVMVVGADKKAHQTDVTLGVRSAGRDQVLKGVNVGQQVVTVGAYGLPDQADVKIEAPTPPGKNSD